MYTILYIINRSQSLLWSNCVFVHWRINHHKIVEILYVRKEWGLWGCGDTCIMYEPKAVLMQHNMNHSTCAMGRIISSLFYGDLCANVQTHSLTMKVLWLLFIIYNIAYMVYFIYTVAVCFTKICGICYQLIREITI